MVLVESLLIEVGRCGFNTGEDTIIVVEKAISQIWKMVDSSPVWADKRILVEVRVSIYVRWTDS